MKKSVTWLVVLSVVILTVGIGATLAYLVSSSNLLENSFSVGSVEISLSETTGTNYTLAPGVTLRKDPVVTVKKGSEACWLFVKVEKSPGFDEFCSFSIEDGWTGLHGYAGVYYRSVDSSAADRRFSLLKDDLVTVRDTLTEKRLEELSEAPTLSFFAYAIQYDRITSPQEAWRLLNS